MSMVKTVLKKDSCLGGWRDESLQKHIKHISNIFTHDLCTIKLKPGRFPAMFYRMQQLTRFIQKFTNFRCVVAKLLQNRIIKSPGSSASTFGQRAAAEQHGMPHLPLQTSSCSTAQQPMVVKQLHGQNLDPVAGQPIKLMGMNRMVMTWGLFFSGFTTSMIYIYIMDIETTIMGYRNGI